MNESKTAYSELSDSKLIDKCRAKAWGWGLADVPEAEMLLELCNRLEQSSGGGMADTLENN